MTDDKDSKGSGRKKDREANRWSGRVRRYARMGGAAGRIAAGLAKERISGPSPETRADMFRAILGSLKGPVMKVAQILATVPGMLPDKMAEELAELQADAPSMGWSFVRRRMKGELGPDWQDKFASFERVAARAASLGQVHKAEFRDGRPLAVKLQYPDMRSTVEADLKQLDVFLRIFREMDGALDTRDVREEVAERLREELDYDLEAKHMALFRHLLKDIDDIRVPAVLKDLSTDRLLTMTWLDGRPVLAFRDADQDTRNRIARLLFRAWYVPLMGAGIIHGDPHPGNYTFDPEAGKRGKLNLLDFGCIRVFDAKFISGVIDLYTALRTGNDDLLMEAYAKWGFDTLNREVIDVLNEWAQFLYGPLIDDRERPIDLGREPGAEGRDVAIRVRQELQRLGPVRPPREFVFMDRAAVGLGSVFTRLGARCNWHRLFEETIADYSDTRLEKTQQAALQTAGLGGKDR